MAGPGRSQREPMERLVRLLAVLSAGGSTGVASERLVAVGQYGEKDAVSQLNRDFAHLRAQGWQIDNIAEPGAAAVYRLVAGDNRLRLRLTPTQQAALQRAALLADRDDLVAALGLPPAARPTDVSADVLLAGHGDELDSVVDAVRERRTLTFRYKGSERVAQPATLRHQNGQWYLTAEESAPDGQHSVKHFVVARMSDVHAGAPGSARRVEPERLTLHPLRWEVDAPVEVTLRAAVEFVPDVERWLLAPDTIEEQDGIATLTYAVTHRAALRQRLYMLGPRVEVVGPTDVRAELIDELRDMAGV